MATGEDRRGDPDWHVDKEDPVPIDGLGEHTSGEETDRPSSGGYEREDADRFGLLPRLGEHRKDHAEDDGRGQRATDALNEAGPDKDRLATREAAHHRSAGEQADAGEEDGAAADEIAEPAGEQQESTEGDEVGVDHPCEAGGREPEVVLDARERNVDHRHVEDDHQHSGAQHVQSDPAGAILAGLTQF